MTRDARTGVRLVPLVMPVALVLLAIPACRSSSDPRVVVTDSNRQARALKTRNASPRFQFRE
jgi:hypothetical protein